MNGRIIKKEYDKKELNYIAAIAILSITLVIVWMLFVAPNTNS